MRLGLKITLRDPDDPAGVIHAQFASVRACPALRDRLAAIARADVAEGLALRRLAIASEALAAADTMEEADRAADGLAELRLQADAATLALVEATRDFLAEGFAAAGADPDRTADLADCVPPEDVAQIRARCLFGAGCLDFTRREGEAPDDPT